jgi:hypothetical protein
MSTPAATPPVRSWARSSCRRRIIGLLAGAAVLAGCAVGERPSLEEPTSFDDDAAEPVADLLDRAGNARFEATYTITPTSAVASTTATVTRTPDSAHIEIGDVVFDVSGNQTRTCTGDDCDDFANDARISDLGITHNFWGPAFRQRLVTDSGRRVGPTTGSFEQIAGRPATCVTIQVPSSLEAVGSVLYCALDDGVLARYQGADVSIELTSFTSTLDVSGDAIDS